MPKIHPWVGLELYLISILSVKNIARSLSQQRDLASWLKTCPRYNLAKQNVHPKIVQERLGHSQISLTLDTYSHVLPGMQEEAALKLDELLTPIAVDLQQLSND